MHAIHGVTRATFVYHQSMYLLIRDKLGASADQPDSTWPEMSRADGEFHRYLEAQGVDINTFVNATGQWMDHFQSDPSGKAMAEYTAEVHQLRGRQPRPTAAEYEQLSRSGQATVHTGGSTGADAIYGVTIDQLAEMFSKEGELRAKHGEHQGKVEFERYLNSRGCDLHVWANAWNGWHARFKADPTGRSEAHFHMLLQQLAAKVHFGDVRDMSGDKEEGITLDQYAQIVVAVSRAGANIDDIVRQFGLQDGAHWQRANAAWTTKMSQDTSHKLTMQYGQLYSKYAGPAFQEEMVAQTAAILASANAPRDIVSEPEEELTPELCLRKMQSPSQKERWRYAGLYAHMADLGNVPDKMAAIATVTPVLLEMIERHDEHTTSDAENGARKLWDLGVRGDEFRGAVSRCLRRAREKLQALQAAFAPIQNQAVPERITLQSSIQDYQSLVETMAGYEHEDWSRGASEGIVPALAPAGIPMQNMPFQHGAPASVAAPHAAGGFPKWIVAPVILVAVGGIFFATRGRAVNAGATAAASASAPVATASSLAVARASHAPAATQSSPPTAPHAAAPASAPVKAKPGKKGK